MATTERTTKSGIVIREIDAGYAKQTYIYPFGNEAGSGSINVTDDPEFEPIRYNIQMRQCSVQNVETFIEAQKIALRTARRYAKNAPSKS